MRDVRGNFDRGTLTLVLAPPGHGKSSLLKSIAGVNTAIPIDGEITYSGLTKEELEKKGRVVEQTVRMRHAARRTLAVPHGGGNG